MDQVCTSGVMLPVPVLRVVRPLWWMEWILPCEPQIESWIAAFKSAIFTTQKYVASSILVPCNAFLSSASSVVLPPVGCEVTVLVMGIALWPNFKCWQLACTCLCVCQNSPRVAQRSYLCVYSCPVSSVTVVELVAVDEVGLEQQLFFRSTA